MLADNPRFNQLMDAAKQRIQATGGIKQQGVLEAGRTVRIVVGWALPT